MVENMSSRIRYWASAALYGGVCVDHLSLYSLTLFSEFVEVINMCKINITSFIKKYIL